MGAKAQRKTDYGDAARATVEYTPKTKVSAANEDSIATPSPALILQQTLSAELSEPEVRKWPPAATVAFVVATCGAFWALVGFGIVAALR